MESASGILLVVAGLLAIILNNSPLSWIYDAFLQTPVHFRFGALDISKPLLLWINDGLMAVFFFLIGLELKREILEGELSQIKMVILPATAALGGMLVPAAIYAWLNWGDPVAINGWAIPTATDIAFALGILLLLGNIVPSSLKLFLISLAVLDDMGAIMIIAVFYTDDLSRLPLLFGLGAFTILVICNLTGVRRLSTYILIGAVMWISVLKSGVHATLAGVLLAFTIPLRNKNPDQPSLLREIEHDLNPFVAFVILPLFAFANAGVSFKGLTLDTLLHPIPMGIAAGLFFGKQLGVIGFSWIAIRLGIARLPAGIGWIEMHGVSLLCGVGFTMSIFISSLAFEYADLPYSNNYLLGILLGSFVSATTGYILLRTYYKKRRTTT